MTLILESVLPNVDSAWLDKSLSDVKKKEKKRRRVRKGKRGKKRVNFSTRLDHQIVDYGCFFFSKDPPVERTTRLVLEF